MEPREKNPKRVGQGKRLGAYNRERFAWMKKERRKHEEEEEEGGLTTFKEEKEEGKEEGKERSHTSTNLLLLPALWWRLRGSVFCGTFRSLRERKKEEQPKQRPRILQRPNLERL